MEFDDDEVDIHLYALKENGKVRAYDKFNFNIGHHLRCVAK
jgi:hypothetical protein